MTKVICMSATLILYFSSKEEQADFGALVEDMIEGLIDETPIVEVESSSDFSFKSVENNTQNTAPRLSKKDAMDFISK
jgi:hypothetical protein